VKIYLAAQFARHADMRDYRDVLTELGCEVTSRWIDLHTVNDPVTGSEAFNSRPQEFSKFAEEDLEDVAAADLVVSFTEGGLARGGRHVEFGYAVALGKELVLIGPREHLFHTLAKIRHFRSFAEFLLAFKKASADLEKLLQKSEAEPAKPRERYGAREALLNDARDVITKDRNVEYGPPQRNFIQVAAVLDSLGYRGLDGRLLQPHDVAVIMISLKLSRLTWDPKNRDSWLDACGYAACGWECTELIEDEEPA
jgi:Domain of unknown function (DUF6378)